MPEPDPRLWVVMGVLALAHLVAPLVRRMRESALEEADSAAGGMAVAYVFLHLLPELDDGHAHVGESIYVVVLAGFLAVFGLEVMADRRRASKRATFWLHLSLELIYTCLVGYTLAEQLPASTFATALFTAALAFHLVIAANGLHERYAREYERSRANVLLALSLAVGAAMALFSDGSERTIDLVTAVIAGHMLFAVFREEMPDRAAVRFGYFVGGAAFVTLAAVLGG